jgi:hypothetical protein
MASKQKTAPKTKATAKVASPKADKKAKRVSLNPQSVIDKKVEALKSIRIKLQYKGRQWSAGDKVWTSPEFSKLSVESLTKLFAK